MIHIRKLTFKILLIVLLTNTTGWATIRWFTAQPIAPNTFGLHWRTDDQGVRYVISRRYNSEDYVEIARYDAPRNEYVDVIPCQPGEIVHYKLEQILLASGKVAKTIETFAVNGVNLIANGDFELNQPGDTKVSPLGISTSGVWNGQVIEGGRKGGKRCLKMTIDKPENAPRYFVGTPYYRINPDTQYTYSWFTYETLNGCAGGVGQAYGYTKDMATSLYAKVASLYVYLTDRDGQWIEYWGQPKLPKDLYYSYVRLWTKGYYQPEPIFIDDIQIIDHDIELLLQTDVEELLQNAQAKAADNIAWLKPQKVNTLRQEMLNKLQTLQKPGDMTMEEFFTLRTALCNEIRELKADLSLFAIYELKNSSK